LNHYELALILNPTLSDKDVQKTAEEMRTMLTGLGAAEVEPERVERRALAYPIRKQHEAAYLLIGFTGPSAIPARVRAELKHREEILRLGFARVPRPPSAAPAAPSTPEVAGG